MVYLKFVLNDKRPKEDNIYPIVIRVTYNRNNTTISTGVRVKHEDWDKNANQVKRTNQNFNLLNQKLTEFYLKVQRAVLKFENDNNFSFDGLKDSLEAKPKVKVEPVTFKKYGEQLVQEMLDVKRTGNAIVYRTAINRLIAFADDPNLRFTEIDYTLLDKFSRKLTIDGAKLNTIGNYLRSIRAIYNKAIKAKLVDRSFYPFEDITIKTEKTAKRALSVGDIVKIYNAKYKANSAKWHARNYFFLSFCLRGSSFTDMAYLTSANVQKQRVIYNRRKTHSQLTIQLLPLTYKILERYKGSNEKYLVPALPKDVIEGGLEAKKVIAQWIKTTNKWLNKIATDCGIDAEVTTYVTRHSWATVAKRLGYSNELIAECLGHSYGNKITNIYLDTFDQHVVDEVNVKVLFCLEPCLKELIHPYRYILKKVSPIKDSFKYMQLIGAAE
jgi:integrase/recombinase XerD